MDYQEQLKIHFFLFIVFLSIIFIPTSLSSVQKNFFETIGEKEKEGRSIILRMMVFGNSYLYVGAVNRVYMLDTKHLEVSKTYNSSNDPKKIKCSESEDCPDNIDLEDFIQLVVQKDSTLIVCGTARNGTCIRLDSSTLTERPNPTSLNLVSNDRKMASFGQFGNKEFSSNFIVATSCKPGSDKKPFHFIADWKDDGSIPTDYSTEISVKYRHSTTIHFKGLINSQDATYFFSNRTLGDPGMKAYVTRICHSDSRTLVDLRMSCVANSTNTASKRLINSEFPELRHVKYTPDLSNEDGYIYAIFSNNQLDSVLCIFKLSHLEQKVKQIIEQAIAGSSEEKIFMESQKQSGKPIIPSKQDLEENYCIKLAGLSPLSSEKITLMPERVVFLATGRTATSLGIMRGDTTGTGIALNIVYVGFEDGKVLKWRSGGESQFTELKLRENHSNPIKDIAVVSRNGLYVLTRKEVMRASACDLNPCVSCFIDVDCKLCATTKSCIPVKYTCKESADSHQGICTDHSISPEQISFKNLADTQFKFQVEKLPYNFENFSCLLEVFNFKDNVSASIKSSIVTCQVFTANKIINGIHQSAKNISIVLNVDGKLWAQSYVKVVSCSEAMSCRECTNFSCVWNTNTLQCQDGATLPDSVTTSKQCPTIEESSTTRGVMFPEGISHSMMLSVRNLPQSYKIIKCGWKGSIGTTAPSSNAVIGKLDSSTNSITCPPAELKYPENVPFKNASLELMADAGLGSFKTFANVPEVLVYKCPLMAENCGQCQSLKPSFGCIWCKNACTFKTLCMNMVGHIGKHEICDEVAITSISPIGGPTKGNTQITIIGRNFGTSSNELQISLNNVICRYIYIQTSDRVTCKTGEGSGKFPVLVKVRKDFKAISSQKFDYNKSLIFDLKPTRGLISGYTTITVKGVNLDYGSVLVVKVSGPNGQQLPVLSRTSDTIIFQTLEVDKQKVVTFYFAVDNEQISPNFKTAFSFLEKPEIEEIEQIFSLVNGGTDVVFWGLRFTNLDEAKLIVYFDDKSNRTGQPCNISDERQMFCPAPDISDVPQKENLPKNHSKLDFGLLMANITQMACLSCFGYETYKKAPFAQLVYYNVPVINQNQEAFHLKPHDKMDFHIDVRSSNDELLKKFDDLHIAVGDVIVKKSEKNIPLRFKLPHYDDVYAKGKHSVPIVLHIGNYKKVIGHVFLKHDIDRRMLIGVIVGLVLGFLTVVIVSYFIFRCCKLKHKKIYQGPNQEQVGLENCNVSLPNLREVSFRGDPKAINPYSQAKPGGSSAEAAPLMGTYADDENYFQNIMKSLDISPEEGNSIFICRDKLQLGDLIGRGNFGSVYVASLLDDNGRILKTVAVKTVDDPDMNQKAVENFVQEGFMMKRFDHPHVLGLDGLCVGYKKEPMVVLPYMPNGDLRSYVRDSSKNFTARELLRLTHQVAQGMAYLASLNFLHRDLAARNCMIDENHIVKVADFGLSHELHEKNYYSTKDQKAKLPIKWMALESLEFFMFTLKSDIWSFGVLMWEVMTRGVTPYPDVEIFETRDYLASGRRLRKPKYCPDNVYEVMMKCWAEFPDQRPTFTDLVHLIELILNPPKRSSSPEPNYFNELDMLDRSADSLKVAP